MSEERWLQDLARVAKEEKEGEAARLDERWDRLSAGRLSAEEEEELRALAASSEEAGEAYELFRPLTSEEQGRMLKALDEQEKASAPEAVAAPSAPSPPEERRVLPFPSRRLRQAGWVSVAMAAAAVIVLVLLRSPSTPSGPFPAYGAAELEGFTRTERSGAREAAGIPGFRSGSELRLLLTPPSRQERVDAGCWFVRPGGLRQTQPCAPGVLAVDPETGSVEVRGTVGEQIRLAPGDWQLCIVAGYRGRLPEGSAACGEAAEAPPGDAYYWVLRKPLRIDPATE